LTKLLTKEQVKKLIEPHLFSQLKKETYQQEKKNPIDLLVANRFDLGFKLLFLKMQEKNDDFSELQYLAHIHALTSGSFTEFGNENKNEKTKFINEFLATYNDIKKHSFDASKGLIPLAEGGRLLNGAHRVASAIFLEKNIETVTLDADVPICNYKFFIDKKVSVQFLDAAATTFIEYAKNIHIAFLWPAAKGHDEKIESVIPNIVYRKNIQLNHNGAHNLLSKTYKNERWLGDVSNNFKGVKAKLDKYFMYEGPLKVIAFQAEDLKEVLVIKDDIRAIFNIGKHAIHITDTQDEAIETARRVFNENSIHFLNNAKPNAFMSTYLKIEQFKRFIVSNGLNSNDTLVDSSLILSLYGLREANDVDYLIDDNNKIIHLDNLVESHDSELKYYEVTKNNMIFNPNNYFYFDDIKFISFKLLYKMKKNRASDKDLHDINMMKALIESHRFKLYQSKMAFQFFNLTLQLKRKKRVCIFFIKQLPINTLILLGLYKPVRKLYHKIKLIVKN
jgi:hypothetical protein